MQVVKKKICVIGKWEGETEENLLKAKKIGEYIAGEGAFLITGGGSGIMEAASKGAKLAGGITLGFLGTTDIETEANKYLDIPIITGMGYSVRSALAIRSCDSIIMIGGGNGTLGEASMAYLEQKPVIVVSNTGGWADKLPRILYEGKYFDERKNMEIRFTPSLWEAVYFSLGGDEIEES